jgi:hypothetical protein
MRLPVWAGCAHYAKNIFVFIQYAALQEAPIWVANRRAPSSSLLRVHQSNLVPRRRTQHVADRYIVGPTRLACGTGPPP